MKMLESKDSKQTKCHLYQQGADEWLIVERTGRQSLEGVGSYKRTSVTQQKAISSMLQQTNNAAMIATADINTLHSMTPIATSEAQKFHYNSVVE